MTQDVANLLTDALAKCFIAIGKDRNEPSDEEGPALYRLFQVLEATFSFTPNNLSHHYDHDELMTISITGEMVRHVKAAYDRLEKAQATGLPDNNPKSPSVEIEIRGGTLQDVRNLPPGWTYTLIDRDDEAAGEMYKTEEEEK